MTGKTFGQTYYQGTDMVDDNRPMLEKTTSGTPFSNIYALYNTSKGYTVNLSLKAEKTSTSASTSWPATHGRSRRA